MAVECESTEYMHTSLLALTYAESVPANTYGHVLAFVVVVYCSFCGDSFFFLSTLQRVADFSVKYYSHAFVFLITVVITVSAL